MIRRYLYEGHSLAATCYIKFAGGSNIDHHYNRVPILLTRSSRASNGSFPTAKSLEVGLDLRRTEVLADFELENHYMPW